MPGSDPVELLLHAVASIAVSAAAAAPATEHRDMTPVSLFCCNSMLQRLRRDAQTARLCPLSIV
jgi:hypothetical protein